MVLVEAGDSAFMLLDRLVFLKYLENWCIYLSNRVSEMCKIVNSFVHFSEHKLCSAGSAVWW